MDIAYITTLRSPDLSRPPPKSCQANPVASWHSCRKAVTREPISSMHLCSKVETIVEIRTIPKHLLLLMLKQILLVTVLIITVLDIIFFGIGVIFIHIFFLVFYSVFLVKKGLNLSFDLIRLIFPTVGANTSVYRQLVSIFLFLRERRESGVILQLLINQALKLWFVVTVTVDFKNRTLSCWFLGPFFCRIVDVAAE